MITIKLYNNLSDKIVVDKNISQLLEMTGSLKDESSVTNPIILIETNDLNVIKSNYMYIGAFGRYYYTTCKVIKTGLVEISGIVDVLMSFKTALLQLKAVIYRQENEWNLYLNDGTFKYYQNPKIITKKFPNGFNTYNYVLALAGGNSAVTNQSSTRVENEVIT